MSETTTRSSATRGRGSYRGGRGGYRGTRPGTKTHSKGDEQENVSSTTLEDQGEIGDLKRKFGSQVPLLREVCPGWSDEDLVFALNETNGDVDSAFDRISSGQISQWGEVKKKQPKAKETPPNDAAGATRGARGRGSTEGRGRGRGTERGRGRAGRGAPQTNGTRTAEKSSKPTDAAWGDASGSTTEAAGAWDIAPTVDIAATGDWASEPVADEALPTPPATAIEEPKVEAGPPPSTKRGGWAGLFAKPPPAPAKKTTPDIPVAQPEDPISVPAVEQEIPSETAVPGDPIGSEQDPAMIPEETATGAPVVLTPSKDELTESNVERLPDFSHPQASHTAASTVASTQDPLASMPAVIRSIRPGMSGYAASALKATSAAGRSASFQRRVMEQHEAVVMPSNQAVDRTAVQFGSMGMNGSPEDGDVDEEREEPETRMQMPEDSPAQARASLPQAEASGPAPAAAPAEQQTQRQAPGLPPIQAQLPESGTPPNGPAYTDPYRYGQPAQKAYDPFGQPQTQQQAQAQAQAQAQVPAPSLEPFSNQVPSQAPPQMPSGHDYASYYGANARDPYASYYGGYGHSQDMQQRTGSAFGTSAPDVQSQYATSRPQQSYGQPEAPGSGHNTPNPSTQGQNTQQSQHIAPNQAYGGYAHAYNAYGQQFPQYGSYAGGHRYGTNRPQFDDVRRQDGPDYYANQYAYGQNQQYAGYNKSMYGQPQQQYGQEYSSSPANTGAYSQPSMPGREAMYGRSGSAQPSDSQQAASNNAFGGMGDPFTRNHSGHGQQHGGSEDSSKYDSVKPSGPSPAIGQSNRPGSAINNMSSQNSGQSAGYAQPQSHTGHQAFGGYPQYGGHQQAAQSGHPQSTYGGYGSNAFANTYGYGGGRGWNGTYGSGH